ncbi:radical SAM protein [Nitrosophilus alvini]|uniref:radical SAM protein n=1 Tax=Nitrosophilus alvini TaxID=2714855 RepID=UPI00190D3815|nr:radical SAM protein [Nitrosophilus alvini]
MRYVFGPVNSRRFGLSLGIDLSPDEKSCNFDCIYCELSPSKPTNFIKNPPKPEEIIKELKSALRKYKNIDVITITSNGEPTLYPYLDILVDMINRIKENTSLLILSNAANIADKNIQNILKKIDIVKLSLDCATQKCFKKIDRPLKGTDINKIIEGIKKFRKKFDKTLIIEILFVKGINDNAEEAKKLAQILFEIKPDRVDIGTIDRPPAYKVQPVSFKKLFELSYFFKELPVNIVSRRDSKPMNKDLSEKEILNTLKHRPFTYDDIKTVLSKDSLKIFEELLKKDLIEKKYVSNVVFYTPKY